MDGYNRRPSGLLVPAEPRIHRPQLCDLVGFDSLWLPPTSGSPVQKFAFLIADQLWTPPVVNAWYTFLMIGGGAGGGHSGGNTGPGWGSGQSAGGAGSGFLAVATIAVRNPATVVIGKGGTDGKDGGTTSVTVDGTTISAPGGKAGTAGQGPGGTGQGSAALPAWARAYVRAGNGYNAGSNLGGGTDGSNGSSTPNVGPATQGGNGFSGGGCGEWWQSGYTPRGGGGAGGIVPTFSGAPTATSGTNAGDNGRPPGEGFGAGGSGGDGGTDRGGGTGRDGAILVIWNE